MTSLDGINGRSIQTLLRGENDSNFRLDENEKIIKETGLISPKGNERGAHFLADCFAVIERCHTDRNGNVIVSLTSTFVVTSIGQLHDDVILLQLPESLSALFSCVNKVYCSFILGGIGKFK